MEGVGFFKLIFSGQVFLTRECLSFLEENQLLSFDVTQLHQEHILLALLTVKL